DGDHGQERPRPALLRTDAQPFRGSAAEPCATEQRKDDRRVGVERAADEVHELLDENELQDDEPRAETGKIGEQGCRRSAFLPAYLREAQWHEHEEDEEHNRSAGREEEVDLIHGYATDDRGVEDEYRARIEEVARLCLDMAQVLTQLAVV